MNHKQKAGEIHSLAWIPQSIHMAFLLLCSFPETCTHTHTNENTTQMIYPDLFLFFYFDLQWSYQIYIVLLKILRSKFRSR